MLNHVRGLAVTAFCWTLLLCHAASGEWVERARVGGGLEIKGDVCIRAEGLGRLERLTLSLWLQPRELPDQWNAVLHSDGWEPGDWHLILAPDGRVQNSVHSNRPSDVDCDAALPPEGDRWYHLAVAYDAPAKKCVVYVDGERTDTIRYTRALPVNLDAFCIGAWNEGERSLHGVFDDVRFYDEPLGAQDVQKLSQGESPAVKPLAWWKLDDGGEQVTDASGNRHHADLVKVGGDAPVYEHPPQPEVNPWQQKGIPSKYAFGAYYTRKHYEEDWHQFSRSDEYADVMVRFGQGPEELVFSRRTSYGPVWITASGQWPLQEVIRRIGDGTAERPDATNRFSRARIIESDGQRVVVHWRYLPELPEEIEDPDPTRFVDEYFLIRPNHRVVRAVRPGAARITDWHEPFRVRVSAVRLEQDDVIDSQVTAADRTAILGAMGFTEGTLQEPTPAETVAITNSIPTPVAAWRFDEGRGETTQEAIQGTRRRIAGHAAYWRQGVSGYALAFDGWYSTIDLPVDKVPRIREKLTIDAWAAVAAYPWNYCPVIQHGDVIDSGPGWFLGFSPHGRPALCVSIGGQRYLLEAERGVERYRWVHVTGVVDAAAGVSEIYVDGVKVASKSTRSGRIDLPDTDPIRIAQGPPLKTAWPVRFAVNYPYTHDGLIDEIRVFDRALSAGQVRLLDEQFDPGEPACRAPDLEKRVLPAGDPEWRNFGARYTHLQFHSVWNNLFRMSGHPDIVVTFDKLPGRYVLWHGVGYIPMMVTENGRWYSNEFNETWWRGCCEPMSDKKMMFGRVHILEQSPARVVLRWRYPLSNIFYGIYGENESPLGWGEWSEWIFLIYPDGSIVKKMRVYESKHHSHEWHEAMAIMGPEQHPETVVDKNNTLELVTADGELRQYNWRTEPPEGVNYRDVVVHKVNLFAEYDPYTIQRFTGGDVYSGERTEYAVFPSWDHWPVSQMPSDGRKSRYSDRTSHSSLTHVRWDFSIPFREQGRFIEKVLLEGLTTENAANLLSMACFFLDPPPLKVHGGGFTARYDINQKAYVLTRDSGDTQTMRFTLHADAEHPLVNPAFVVANWGADGSAVIRIDGRSPRDDMDLRQGVVSRANGVNALVIWIETTANTDVDIAIERSADLE